jgi:hypothetical protein
MKIRQAQTIYIYNEEEYSLGKEARGNFPNTLYLFIPISTGEQKELFLEMRDIEKAYRIVPYLSIQNCSVIFKGFIEDSIKVWIQPGVCAEKLNGKEIAEGGWFESIIQISEVERAWEERYPVDGYIFPEGLSPMLEITEFTTS